MAHQASVEAYYERLPTDAAGAQRFRPTRHVEGAWQPGEQHMAPVSGVLVHAIETALPESGGPGGRQVSRVSFDILGMIPAEDFAVTVEVLRPGRTIELVEATMAVADRPVVRARAWLLARQDTGTVAGGQPDPLPPPDGVTAWSGSTTWSGGYIQSLEMRPLPGGVPGRSQVWLTTPLDLVAEEPVSNLARYVGLVDTANGIAVRQPPTEWMFPNVDLTLHLYRQPVWGWVGLDTTVIFGSDGVGLTSTVLHDGNGPVGRAEQALTIRSRFARTPPASVG